MLDVLPSCRHYNKARKEKKSHTDKKETKLSLFVNDMIVYAENPKESTQNPTTTIMSLASFQDTG